MNKNRNYLIFEKEGVYLYLYHLYHQTMTSSKGNEINASGPLIALAR